MGYNDQKISRFNAAALKIMNLNNIWNDSRYHREQGNLVKVRWILDSAEMELGVDIQKFKRSKEVDDVNNKIKDSKGLKLYESLVEKETILRNVEDQAGKGATYGDPDEDDMD